MNGKILGDGVIRGDDGRRYLFNANEIQNAQGKSIDDLIGSEVDFEIANGGGAISIYITEFKSVLPQNNFSQHNLSQSNISQTPQKMQISQSTQPPHQQTIKAQNYMISQILTSIKTKFFVYVGLLVVASFFGGVASGLSESWDSAKRDFGVILAIVAVGCSISAFIVLYFALRHLWQVAKSRVLQKSTHAFIITLIVSVLLGVILSALINEVFFLIIFGGFIYCFILRYRIYKEVAYITNQPLFMWAFWLSIIAVIVYVFAKHYGFLPISIALDFIVVIIYIIAWIKAKEIRLSKSAREFK